MSSASKPTVSDLLKKSDYQNAYDLMIQNGDDPEKILDYLSARYFQNSKADNHKYWSFIQSNNNRFAHYNSESFIPALSKYFQRHNDSFKSLIVEISEKNPETIIQSLRHSGFFLNNDSKSWDELEFLKYHPSAKIKELHDTISIISKRNIAYLNKITSFENLFKDSSINKILRYIALYMIKHIVPLDVYGTSPDEESVEKINRYTSALNDILKRKIESMDQLPDLNDSNSCIDLLIMDMIPDKNANISVEEMKQLALGWKNRTTEAASIFFDKLSYKLKDSSEFQSFEHYVNVLVEYNSWKYDAVYTFCYDMNYDYHVENDVVLLACKDSGKFKRWIDAGDKINRNSIYWNNIAQVNFNNYGLNNVTIGKKQNDAENKDAIIRSIATTRMMSDLYGIDKINSNDSSCYISFFQFALNFNLMRKHFYVNFIKPYLNSEIVPLLVEIL